MYRNCFFDSKDSKIYLWTWNADMERVCIESDFSPYLYITCPEDKKNAESIYGEPLKKRTFATEKLRKEFVELKNGDVYFNIPPEQQFLLEKFREESIEKLTQYQLKVFVFDIEVDCGDVFPDPQKAEFPINVITVHDSIENKFHVFGTGKYDEYTIKDEFGDQIDYTRVIYSECEDERDLLKKFIRLWRKDFPDVVVGWNSANFDIPYVMNRLKKLYGDKKINVLSPVGRIRSKMVRDKFGRENEEFVIAGISCLDYMLLYRSYALKELESVALNTIAQNELKIGKVEYNQVNLSHLAHEDWNRFVNYNIQDVNIIIQLEEKLKYLEIARFIANSGFCNLEKAVGKVAVITGILAQRALAKNQIIPTKRNDKADDETQEKIPGGWVMDPIPGYYEDLCSFDANSLYPNIMITLNMSPETKVGKIKGKKEDKYMLEYKGKKVVATMEEIDGLVKKNNLTLSRSGILFTQKFKGIGPEFVDELYQKRKYYKGLMLKDEKKLETIKEDSPEYKRLKSEIVKNNVTQQLYKVLLNSTYGVFANPHFAMFDLDCAKSITLTGQAMIRQAEKICNEWACENGATKPSILYVDTDSCFLQMAEITNGIPKLDAEGNIAPEFAAKIDACQKRLNRDIDIWAREKLGSNDPRFFFKMEKYIQKLIMVKKKHYILKVKNDEGIRCDKTVIKGMLLVKSSLSAKIRNKGKEIIEDIFSGKSEKDIRESLYRMYDEFMGYSLDDIAFRISLKTADNPRYISGMSGLTWDKSARIPSQVRCAQQYNYLISKLHLEGKYPKLVNGMKARLLYVNKNKYGLNRVAYASELPAEFDIEADYTLTFNKTIEACLKSVYDTLGWSFPDIRYESKNDIEALFS